MCVVLGWVGFVGVVGVGVGEWWVLCGGGWWWWWSGGEAKGGWVCVGCWEVCVSRLGPRFCQDGTFPVWWASVSVSGGCCVVVGGGGGGRGAKPRVGGCAFGVGRCVFRGLGQDFAKMVHFRPSENLENNFRQHVVLLEYLPTRYCCPE